MINFTNQQLVMFYVVILGLNSKHYKCITPEQKTCLEKEAVSFFNAERLGLLRSIWNDDFELSDLELADWNLNKD